MNILDAASSIGLVLKQVSPTKGGEYAGPCPSCGGTDRFRVWPADKGGGGSYWCRATGNGCGKCGDLVQFLVDFCGYRYREAFRAAGRELPDTYRVPALLPETSSKPKAFEPRVYDNPVETWQKKAGDLVEKAHAHLLQTDKVLSYLESRGLNYDAVRSFRLGWLPGEGDKHCLFRPRESWGLDTIEKPDGRKKKLWIPRGIVIPCFKDNTVYRIRIRRPKADLSREWDVKYFVVPGSGMEAMVLYPDRRAFVVVESELDAMMLARKAGSVAGVVSLGSAQKKPGSEVYYLLRQALRVLVSLDFDEAGLGAWTWWKNEFHNARQWPVPDGKDPGEAFEKGVDLLRWVMDGLPPALTIHFPEPGQAREPHPVQPASSETVPDLPASLIRFKQLLDQYPIKARASLKRSSLIFAPNWHNHDIEKEASRLMFFDPDVFDYLHDHPEDIIHRGNFDLQPAPNHYSLRIENEHQ